MSPRKILKLHLRRDILAAFETETKMSDHKVTTTQALVINSLCGSRENRRVLYTAGRRGGKSFTVRKAAEALFTLYGRGLIIFADAAMQSCFMIDYPGVESFADFRVSSSLEGNEYQYPFIICDEIEEFSSSVENFEVIMHENYKGPVLVTGTSDIKAPAIGMLMAVSMRGDFNRFKSASWEVMPEAGAIVIEHLDRIGLGAFQGLYGGE